VTTSDWQLAKEAFPLGAIVEGGGAKLLVESHDEFEQEFWGQPVMVRGFRCRNLDNYTEQTLPAQFWHALRLNLIRSQEARDKTNEQIQGAS
jgi:hypothetical protein